MSMSASLVGPASSDRHSGTLACLLGSEPCENPPPKCDLVRSPVPPSGSVNGSLSLSSSSPTIASPRRWRREFARRYRTAVHFGLCAAFYSGPDCGGAVTARLATPPSSLWLKVRDAQRRRTEAAVVLTLSRCPIVAVPVDSVVSALS